MYSPDKETMKRSTEDLPPKDPAQQVQFGGPIVAPGVTDPQALRYAQQIHERRAGGPSKYTTPVAGGPTPPIPRLDSQADKDLTMADQANMQRAAMEGPPQAPAPRSMFQAGPHDAPPPSRGPGGPPAGILPADILPEEARKDPEFHEGQGSMYASAQPALAFRYGVIRGGQRLMPQQLGQVAKGLSKKTVEGLQSIVELQKTRASAESEDKRIEREAAAGVGGAAGRLGNSPTDGPQADAAASQKNIQEAVKKLDDFDFNTFREMMMKDIINNEEQRDLIEKRCTPLDITDLIMRGFVTQRVPVIPNKFEPEFQSMTGGEDLAIKRLIMQESKGLEVSDRYLLDKFSLMAVTIGLRAINGNVIPTHQDNNGKFDEEAFWRKFDFVSKYPFHMLASLGVNYFWFDIRVRKLFVAEKLGNG
jgi:hypothetical protein